MSGRAPAAAWPGNTNTLAGNVPPKADLGDLRGLAAGLDGRVSAMINGSPDYDGAKAYKDSKVGCLLLGSIADYHMAAPGNVEEPGNAVHMCIRMNGRSSITGPLRQQIHIEEPAAQRLTVVLNQGRV